MPTLTPRRVSVVRIPRQPTAPTPAAHPPPMPTVYRLHNPWTFHLVSACATAAATVVGGFVAAAVFDQARLDWIVGSVGVSLVLVLALSSLHTRFEKNPPASAFKPVDLA